MASKIHCNDEVIVITGKDKGKRGRVLKKLNNKKVIVKGIMLFKRYKKSKSNIKQINNIIEKESAIDISNIAIYNNNNSKSDKIYFDFKNGKKKRLFKSNNEILN